MIAPILDPRTRLTRKEAADYMGVSTQHIQNLVSAGLLSQIKPGRYAYYTVADLDRYIESKKTKALI